MGLRMRYLNLKQQIREVRMLAIRGIAEAGSGHPGASFSAAEIMGGLYFRKMRHDPLKPHWHERDYFVNSKLILLQDSLLLLLFPDIFPSVKWIPCVNLVLGYKDIP